MEISSSFAIFLYPLMALIFCPFQQRRGESNRPYKTNKFLIRQPTKFVTLCLLAVLGGLPPPVAFRDDVLALVCSFSANHTGADVVTMLLQTTEQGNS
jgi:hypothetical protein